ncbi:MAG: ECF transporter S component [Pyramidobacter sp.]
MNLKDGKVFSIRQLTVSSVMAAVAAVLLLMEIPMPMLAPFLKLDFSEVPAMLSGLLLGRGAGVLVVLMKNLLHLMFHGSTSMGIGEVVNITGGLIYLLVSLAIFDAGRTTKSAAGGLAAGTLCVSFAMLALNYYVVLSVYARLMGLTLDSIVKAVHAVNPSVNDTLTFLFYSLLPFNLVKYGLTSILVFVLYTRLRRHFES